MKIREVAEDNAEFGVKKNSQNFHDSLGDQSDNKLRRFPLSTFMRVVRDWPRQTQGIPQFDKGPGLFLPHHLRYALSPDLRPGSVLGLLKHSQGSSRRTMRRVGQRARKPGPRNFPSSQNLRLTIHRPNRNPPTVDDDKPSGTQLIPSIAILRTRRITCPISEAAKARGEKQIKPVAMSSTSGVNVSCLQPREDISRKLDIPPRLSNRDPPRQTTKSAQFQCPRTSFSSGDPGGCLPEIKHNHPRIRPSTMRD